MSDQLAAAQFGYLPLLAANARNARQYGQCALCRGPVAPGQRVADLADGRGLVHVGCTGQAQ